MAVWRNYERNLSSVYLRMTVSETPPKSELNVSMCFGEFSTIALHNFPQSMEFEYATFF